MLCPTHKISDRLVPYAAGQGANGIDRLRNDNGLVVDLVELAVRPAATGHQPCSIVTRGECLVNNSNTNTNNTNTVAIVIGTVIAVLLLILVFGGGGRMMTGGMMGWWR